MKALKLYTEENCLPFISKRGGETKFGEAVQFVSKLEDLKKLPAKYVLLGIPEDIGVRANYGNEGTSKAWEHGLKSLLNIQKNEFTEPENVIILGEIDCETQMTQASQILKADPHFAEKLGELVTQIDHKVSEIIEIIISANKIPIIIGGGHNNSCGTIKGTSKALQQPINCINFDAHSDFRALEHRHSGNGFSYAFEDGFLDKYFIFGLHRNYTSESVFSSFEKNIGRVEFNLFEDISIQQKISFSEALHNAEDFCCGKPFGLELDMDAIENMGSSALTPSGFSMNEARRFISYFSKNNNFRYIHICEGSPEVRNYKNQVGKAIAYLVSDVISKLK